MSEYIGTRCMVCTEKFTSEDDVVVCPECGTPYHRECYKKEGKCVNELLHRSGGSWKPTYDTGRNGSEAKEVVCKFCGNTNPPLTLFCRRCGMPSENIQNEADRASQSAQTYNGMNINENADAYNQNMNGGININPYLINFSDPLCGFSPDEDVEGVKMADLADFVGTNTHYYLPIFKRIKETGRAMSWNFCAMLFPELYFSYRKMPLMALLAWFLKLISQIPQEIVMIKQVGGMGLLSQLVEQVNVASPAFKGVLMIGYALFYSVLLVLGFNANKIYYNAALRRIKKAKSNTASADIRGDVVRSGGTSALLLVLFILLMALPTLAIYILQMMPAVSAVGI